MCYKEGPICPATFTTHTPTQEPSRVGWAFTAIPIIATREKKGNYGERITIPPARMCAGADDLVESSFPFWGNITNDECSVQTKCNLNIS